MLNLPQRENTPKKAAPSGKRTGVAGRTGPHGSRQFRRILVTVDFTGKKRPNAYIVRIEPEGERPSASTEGRGTSTTRIRSSSKTSRPPGMYSEASRIRRP